MVVDDGDAAVRPVRKPSGRNAIVTSQRKPAPQAPCNPLEPSTIVTHLRIELEYMPAPPDNSCALRTPRAPRPSLP